MALQVTYEGNEYILDLEDMDTDQARAMERLGVPNLKALENGIGEGDVDALTVAYWLMLVQNGEPGARIERVKFKPIKFLRALAVSVKTDKAEETSEAEDSPKEAG
jgi:hypothetical protein